MRSRMCGRVCMSHVFREINKCCSTLDWISWIDTFLVDSGDSLVLRRCWCLFLCLELMIRVTLRDLESRSPPYSFRSPPYSFRSTPYSFRLPGRLMTVAAYVSIRQHTSAYVSIRQHTSACVSIRQHASAYVSIRQHTSLLLLSSGWQAGG